ncbi:MAG: paraquat-inducible protein A [Mesorhizobium sp.]|nr:paraquat-inducible protein A [Mesorhizobium sp.]
MRFLLPAVLCGATFCFALGITLPLIRVERLWLFSDEPSLAVMVRDLFLAGDWPIASILGLFSIVFPAAKLLLLHVAAYAGPGAARVPGWFRALSNWSMLDVVLVALVIFAARTSGLASAFTQPGLWFFAGSVVLTVVATALVKRRDGEPA